MAGGPRSSEGVLWYKPHPVLYFITKKIGGVFTVRARIGTMLKCALIGCAVTPPTTPPATKTAAIEHPKNGKNTAAKMANLQKDF
jgi:hypothetical protein